MTERQAFFHTTPIYYVNDVPHPGHAYTTMAADALARARRIRGRDVFFLTGTDEHGQNIERIAREKGLPVKDYCDEIAGRFRGLWERLDIRYDRFIRTTDEVHKRGVLKLWERLLAARDGEGRPAVYRSKYAGWYCPRCEAFKDEDELKQPGNACPDHERPCEWTEEENFFFRLSAYEGWLREEIESERLLIEPAGRRNEVLAVIRQGLKDFSVSRARVKWGIPVPGEPGHVFYVWMDALANYITALGYGDGSPEYRRYWEESAERLHFVGKEIIRFHCLYWPAMLHAAGLPTPNRIFAHGWLTRGGRKLSKTTGNTIDPDDLIDRYGSDAFRYFFLREGSFGQDWDFTEEAFRRRYNADLANDLGNLASRALTMASRFCDGKVPAGRPVPRPGAVGYAASFPSHLEERLETAFQLYEDLDFAGALTYVWNWLSGLNREIVQQAPWEMAKDPVARQDLEAFLYDVLEVLRFSAVAVSPVLPRAAGRIFKMLGLEDRDPRADDLAWGRLKPGAPLGPVEPLFPRLERPGTGPEGAPPEKGAREEIPQAPPAGHATQAVGAAAAETIDIADFSRVELRVGQVKAAEKVPGSKRLVKMEIDLGGEVRQVVAGIAGSYAPEALVGKRVAVVANLKPAKLMGVESNGMVLAASLDGRAVLCTFEEDVPAGTKIK